MGVKRGGKVKTGHDKVKSLHISAAALVRHFWTFQGPSRPKAARCLSLATKADAADAVLAIEADTRSEGGEFGSLGVRNWIASGNLTLKSGDLVWSHSERFADAPFKSGGKTAGNLLVRRLADAVGCKDRR
jgi:hypothetical protein